MISGTVAFVVPVLMVMMKVDESAEDVCVETVVGNTEGLMLGGSVGWILGTNEKGAIVGLTVGSVEGFAVGEDVFSSAVVEVHCCRGSGFANVVGIIVGSLVSGEPVGSYVESGTDADGSDVDGTCVGYVGKTCVEVALGDGRGVG